MKDEHTPEKDDGDDEDVVIDLDGLSWEESESLVTYDDDVADRVADAHRDSIVPASW